MESQKYDGNCLPVCQVKHDAIKIYVKLEVKMAASLIASVEGASRQPHATAVLPFFCVYTKPS